MLTMPEHVDVDAERHIGLDLGAHEIGEVNAMRDVGMANENAFDGWRVGDVHRLELRPFKFCEDRLVRLVLANHHRNAALEEIAHHGGADEPCAPCYEEFHLRLHHSPPLDKPPSARRRRRALSESHLRLQRVGVFADARGGGGAVLALAVDANGRGRRSHRVRPPAV